MGRTCRRFIRGWTLAFFARSFPGKRYCDVLPLPTERYHSENTSYNTTYVLRGLSAPTLLLAALAQWKLLTIQKVLSRRQCLTLHRHSIANMSTGLPRALWAFLFVWSLLACFMPTSNSAASNTTGGGKKASLGKPWSTAEARLGP